MSGLVHTDLCGYWKVTFNQSLYIKSFAIMNRDNDVEVKWRRIKGWAVTVGSNTDPTRNTICKDKGTMLEGGFYMCPLALYGNVFGIWDKSPNCEYINFLEAMVYT